ncbi:hypothetical protein [uncultured Oscillibacter sp.]|uniref:hypothetical protein n=1 Tax=uncultured Oscillibacter sp. TaxID=876091 RepID=UPI00266F886F|nr:hypothetical protein [uncultured Oscillibacter sp.]
MANDGTVKIGAEIDEKEFLDSLSKLSKTAKSALNNITVDIEVDKKGFSADLSKLGKDAEPVEVPIEADTAKFKKGLDDLEREAQKNVVSLKELNGALKLNPKSTDLLIEKQKLLQSAVSAAAKKADELNSALKSAKASGEVEKNAEAYRKLVIEFSNAEAEAKNMQAELDDVSAKLKNGQGAIEDLEDVTDDLGRSYTSVGDIIKGVALGDLISSGVQAAISGIKDLVGEFWNLDDATKEFREGQGKLNAAFEAAHLGPEAAKQAYSDFYKILGDTDTAVEASQLLATLTNSEEDLATWTNIAAGVFGTFGDALPIEGLIEAANETAKTGKVTGVLADALNWAGISEDYFNEELKWAGSESMRNQRIMKTLSVAYAEAALAFNRNNKEIIAARENQIQLDEAMATVGETISKIKNSFLNELSPVISEIAGKFAELAASVDWEELASRVGDFVGSIDLDSIFDTIENALRNVDFDSLFDTIGDIIGGLISFAQAIAPVVSTVAEFGAQLFGFFERMNPQVKLFLVGFLGAIVAVGKLGSAISSVGGAVSGVGKIASAFSTGAGDQVYNTFLKWSVIIIAIITSLTLLIAMINTLMGKGDDMKSTLNSMGGAMNGMGGGAPRSGSASPGGAPRARARMAAMPANDSDGNDGEGASITAGTFSRAATVRALESAIPNVESRVAMATAAMAPAAGYSAPPMDHSGGGADYRQPVQQPTQQTITINFTGDLAQLGRVLKPVIDIENRRIGPGV